LAAPTRQLQIFVGSLCAGCVIFMAMHFPTRSRVAAWIESKSDRIAQQRQVVR
jgi:hypothetical protein